MFGCNTSVLPSCNTYAEAKNIYTRAPIAERKAQMARWPDGVRPLDDFRKEHYAVLRNEDRIAFRLYRTEVVVWTGPTTCEIDVGYDSSSTRSFARRFMPSGVHFTSYRDQQCVVDGAAGAMARIGRISLRQDIYSKRWIFASEVTKPTRQVQDPDKRAEVNAKLKPLFDYIRAIWAVSGNTDCHPWAGQPVVLAELGDMPIFEYQIKMALNKSQRWAQTYPAMHADELITRIRNQAYEDSGVNICIDYDQPIPRRTKS